MHEHGLSAIKATFEQFGVEFLGESGLRIQALTHEQGRGGSPSGQLSPDPCRSEVRVG